MGAEGKVDGGRPSARVGLRAASATRSRGFLRDISSWKQRWRASLALLALVVALVSALPRVATAAGPFVDAGPQAGFPQVQYGVAGGLVSNVCAVDFDGDGDDDFVVLLGQGLGVRLLRNDSTPGVAQFTDVTGDHPGLASLPDDVATCVAGDFDGDGDQDLYVGTLTEDHLLWNEDAVLVWRGPRGDTTHAGWSVSAAVADFDLDGDDDIYVVGYIGRAHFPLHDGEPNRLLVNDGTGWFTEQAVAFGLADDGTGLSALWTDADGDGDLDLFVVNDFGMFVRPGKVYRNPLVEDGAPGPFEDVSEAWGFDGRLYGMGIAQGDFNRDGRPDYYVTSIARARYLVGLTGGGFQEMTDTADVGARYGTQAYRATWVPLAMDLDGDGYDDLYVRTGHVPGHAFLKNDEAQDDLSFVFGADGEAADFASVLLPEAPEKGRGAIVVDVDRDGRPDIVAASSSSAPRLFLAKGPSSSVEVRLRATLSSPSAAGAVLTVSCGVAQRVEWLSAGGHQGSGGPMATTYVGIPAECGTTAALAVRWPSGVRQEVGPVSVGQSVTVEEPAWFQWEESPVLPKSLVTAVLTPPDAAGQPLGPGHSVVLDAPTGMHSAPWSGDAYVVSFPAPDTPGSYRVRVLVDGEPLPFAPTLRVASAAPVRVALRPSHPVAGRPAELWLDGPGAVDASVDVVGLAGLSQKAAVDGVAVYGGVVDAFADKVSATVTLPDGSSVQIDREVVSPFEPSMSRLDVAYPLVATGSLPLGPMVNVSATLRDANGSSVMVDVADVTVLLDGMPLPADVIAKPDGFLAQVPSAALYPYGVLQAFVGGIQVPPDATIRPVASEEDVAALVDPGHPAAWTAFDGCRADGQDLLGVFALWKTAEGFALPHVTSVGLEVVGADVVPDSLNSTGGFSSALVRCGDSPGVGTLQLVLAGVPVGVPTPFTLWPPKGSAVDPLLSELFASTDTPQPGDLVDVVVVPRRSDGTLAGSGHDVTLQTNPPLGAVQATYCTIGRYCATLAMPAAPALVTVQAFVDGALLDATLQLVVGEFDGTGGAPDASTGDVWADASALDAASADTIGGDAASQDAAGPDADASALGDAGAAGGPDAGADAVPFDAGVDDTSALPADVPLDVEPADTADAPNPGGDVASALDGGGNAGGVDTSAVGDGSDTEPGGPDGTGVADSNPTGDGAGLDGGPGSADSHGVAGDAVGPAGDAPSEGDAPPPVDSTGRPADGAVLGQVDAKDGARLDATAAADIGTRGSGAGGAGDGARRGDAAGSHRDRKRHVDTSSTVVPSPGPSAGAGEGGGGGGCAAAMRPVPPVAVGMVALLWFLLAGTGRRRARKARRGSTASR